MLQAGAVDKSKLTPNLQKQVDVMESIRQNMGSLFSPSLPSRGYLLLRRVEIRLEFG